MKYMTINNQKVAFDDEKNVLSVIRKAGINLPTFCYHSELSTYGACRMCVVEDDRGKIFASCSEVPRDGMVIYTNTPKLQHHRKMILELMLSAHCRECTTCKKNGDCTLQNLAKQLGVSYIRFENNKPQIPIDESSDCIVIDKNKCILCGDCVRTCEEIQGLGILDFAYRGSKMQVMPAFDRKMAETACVGCGQCRVVCPTGAITIKHNIHPVWEALADKNTRVVVQIAPAVRVAVGDKFGIPKGENSLGKLVAALRRMGFDEIYDTDFGADLTIMEESKEFLERVESGEKLPLFTSCCPAWVKFCEQKYPELRANISTCRSPQQMFGSNAKTYWEEKMGIPREKLVVVSIMPCLAKKYECDREEFKVNGNPDVDYSISTRELATLIKRANIGFHLLPDSEFDHPMGESTGAGVIFGTTGGVMEAALRSVYEIYTGNVLENVNFENVRGLEGVRRATINLNGFELKVGIAHGLGNARRLLEDIRNGHNEYHAIEIMACPGGCIGGGGQPLHHGRADILYARARALYQEDAQKPIRKSHENPYIQKLYEEYLGKPLSEKAHMLLHTHYFNKSID